MNPVRSLNFGRKQSPGSGKKATFNSRTSNGVNLVDSCGWIEFFTDGPLAEEYFKHLRDPSNLITPSIIVYEVYKIIKRERTEEEALIAVAQIGKTRIILLTQKLALEAADYSLQYRLPMADAIVYATGVAGKAKIISSDPHFENLPFVLFIPKK